MTCDELRAFGGSAHTSTGGVNARSAADAISLVLDRYKECFGDRLHSIYLVGSFARNETVSSSDVDLLIIFGDRFKNDGERRRAVRLRDQLCARSPIELDISLREERELRFTGDLELQAASNCLFGSDLCDELPAVDPSFYGRRQLHAVPTLFSKARLSRSVLTLPLDYPDPAMPFLGYEGRPLRLPGGEMQPGMKFLSGCVTRPASALVTQHTGRIVTNKRDCVDAYGRYIGDEWHSLVERVVSVVRGQWAYAIPTRDQDRRELRQICQRTRAFEIHFLNRYLGYIRRDLEAGPLEFWLPTEFESWHGLPRPYLEIGARTGQLETRKVRGEMCVRVPAYAQFLAAFALRRIRFVPPPGDGSSEGARGQEALVSALRRAASTADKEGDSFLSRALSEALDAQTSPDPST